MWISVFPAPPDACTPGCTRCLASPQKIVAQDRETAGENALYQAALYSWLSEDRTNARQFIDKLCKMNKKSANGLALRGWLEVTSGREANQKKSEKYFNEAFRLAGIRAADGTPSSLAL